MKEPKLKTVYVCSNCGETSPRWMGRCPSCGSWNTMNEDVVAEALKAAETLAAEGINVRVINVCSIKPLDEETILAAARECGKIVTCEEHSIIGGLGEAVCSLVSEKHPVPVRRVGVNDEFGHSGPAAALLEEMGLCASHIAEVVRETVKG